MIGLALFILAVAILLALLGWGLARAAANGDHALNAEPNVVPACRADIEAILLTERGDERR